MSAQLVEMLRRKMPERYGSLSDNEAMAEFRQRIGTSQTQRQLETSMGLREVNTGETVRRAVQGFGNQAAFGFGSELAQAAAPLAQNVLGALDYAGTAISGGDLKKAADRWNAAIAGAFDVDLVSEAELDRGRQDAPVAMGASELAGGVAGAAMPLKLPGAIAGRMAQGRAIAQGANPIAANAIRRATKMSVNRAMAPTTLPRQVGMGAAEGALFGAGNAPEGDRLGGALTGAAMGAAAPAVLRGAVQGGRTAAALSPVRNAAGAAGAFGEGMRQGFQRGYSPAGAAWMGARRAGARMMAPYTKAATEGVESLAGPPPGPAAQPVAGGIMSGRGVPETAPPPPTMDVRMRTGNLTRNDRSPPIASGSTIDLPEPLPDSSISSINMEGFDDIFGSQPVPRAGPPSDVPDTFVPSAGGRGFPTSQLDNIVDNARLQRDMVEQLKQELRDAGQPSKVPGFFMDEMYSDPRAHPAWGGSTGPMLPIPEAVADDAPLFIDPRAGRTKSGARPKNRGKTRKSKRRRKKRAKEED